MTRRFAQTLAVVLLALVCSGVAAAQQPQSPPPPSMQPTPAGYQTSRETPLLTLSFPGGTVGEYVEHIHEAFESDDGVANIILKGGVENAPVPAVDLQSVSVEGALMLLHHHEAETEDEHWRVELDRIHASGLPIYILSAKHYSKSATAQQEVHVWNVSQLLSSGIKADDMLTAIESALALVRAKHEPAEIRFHEATGLIMARGVKEQLGTIDQVVNQLHETATHRSNAQAREQALQEAQQVLQQAEERQRRLEAAQREANAMKNSREGVMREHLILQSNYNTAQRRVEELERTIAELQAELKGRDQRAGE